MIDPTTKDSILIAMNMEKDGPVEEIRECRWFPLHDNKREGYIVFTRSMSHVWLVVLTQEDMYTERLDSHDILEKTSRSGSL